MTLNFPNRSRSYEPTHQRIRFWGHDGSMEVTFLLEEEALFKLNPATEKLEAGILVAFDAARERIIAVATRVYAPRQRQSFYALVAADF